MLKFIPATSNSVTQLLLARDAPSREVASSNFGIHFDLRIWRDQVIRNGAALKNLGGWKKREDEERIHQQENTNARTTNIHSKTLTITHLNPCVNERIVLHVGHGHESVNLGYSEPMEHIGH